MEVLPNSFTNLFSMNNCLNSLFLILNTSAWRVNERIIITYFLHLPAPFPLLLLLLLFSSSFTCSSFSYFFPLLSSVPLPSYSLFPHNHLLDSNLHFLKTHNNMHDWQSVEYKSKKMSFMSDENMSA